MADTTEASAPVFPGFVRTVAVRRKGVYLKKAPKRPTSDPAASIPFPAATVETSPDVVARRFALSLHLRNVLAHRDQRLKLKAIALRLTARRVGVKVTRLLGPINTARCMVNFCKPDKRPAAPKRRTQDNLQTIVFGAGYGALTFGNDETRAVFE